MRFDTPTTPAEVTRRVRSGLGRLGRRLSAQPPASRWALGLAGAVGLAALGYSATAPAPQASGVFLRPAERFSTDDLVSVRRALDDKHVTYRVDSLNRVEVSFDQIDAANDALGKVDVGPRSVREIERKAAETTVWDLPSMREQRHDRAESDRIAEMIRRAGGLVDVKVEIHRPKARGLTRTAAVPSAVVWLETEGGRELSSREAERIQSLIAGFAPDVPKDAVSVLDSKLNNYADAHDPSVGIRARTRDRQNDFRQKILEELSWVKGLQVTVQVAPAPAPLSATPGPTSAAPPSGPGSPPPPPPAAEEIALPAPSVAVNRPLELSPEPAHAPPADPPHAAPAPAAGPVPADAQAAPKVRVWAKVPRSYYLRALADRVPSHDDLRAVVERTRATVEQAVRLVVPPGQLEALDVSTIPDDLPAWDVPAPAAPAARRPVAWWWVPAGAGAVLGSAAAALAVGYRAARRPRPAARPRDDARRYKIDEADADVPGPGPSERVRDLIRQNPEAAAGVLHRWAGHGRGHGQGGGNG